MRKYLSSERILLRELVPNDAEAVFALDSDPHVHQSIGENLVINLPQSKDLIEYIRQQYIITVSGAGSLFIS